MALDTDTIDHPTLQRLAKAGALHAVTVAGDPEGWAIVAQVRQTQYPLVSKQKDVRHFRRMESAVRYLRKVGVERFEVDARHFDEDAMRRGHRRPDTAAALKRAHDAAAYDQWFREQVEAGLREADKAGAKWYTTAEVHESTTAAIERGAKRYRERQAKADAK